MSNSVDLERFVSAQAAGGIYQQALRELRGGRKTSHWMWFVFPQVAGLGSSAISRRYAIRDLEEAQAYVRHPLLGPRLLECTAAVVAHGERRPEEIFGAIDAVKLRSSMTLFACAAPDELVFTEVLSTRFEGAADQLTLQLIGRPNPL